MIESGYSGTPVAQKLGLKDGQRALFIELPVMALMMLAALPSSVVVSAELTATPREVARVLWGCWEALTAEELGNDPRSAPESSDIVCFDGEFGVETQATPVGGQPSPMVDGGAYEFRDDRLVLTPAVLGETWFWPRSEPLPEVGCDVHIRSHGITVLSGCRGPDTRSGQPLADVIIGKAAPRTSGQPIAVENWSQLQGCWSHFDQEEIRTDKPGSVSIFGYCFEGPEKATSTNFWTMSIDDWRRGRGDGEGYEGAVNYSLSESRLTIWSDDQDATLTCAAEVIGRAKLILSDCDEESDNGLYLGAGE